MTNNSTNFTNDLNDDINHNLEFRIQYTVIIVAVMPIIIFGNSLVLLAIATEKKLKTNPNLFVSSLAIADLLVGLVVIPLYIVSYWDDGFAKRSMFACMIQFSLVVLSCGSSLFSLMFVALDRYIAIIFPFKYSALVTTRRVRIAIVSIWIYYITVSSLPLLGWSKWHPGIRCEFYTVMEPGYTAIAVFLTVSLPLTATTYMYIHIFIQVRKMHSKMRKTYSSSAINNNENSNSETNQAREEKSARVMAVVYFLFVCFWLPYILVSPLRYVIHDQHLMIVLKNFMLCGAMSNSAVNPIVYAWMRKSFKKQFLKLLHCTYKSV